MLEVATIQHGPYLSTKSRQLLMNRVERTKSRELIEVEPAKFSNTMNITGDKKTKQKKGGIEIIRDRPVDELLYQDAKRRQQSIEHRQKEAIAKSHQSVPLVSRESQKLVIQRFERELNAAIYELHQTQRIEDMLAQSDNSEQFIHLPMTLNYLTMSKLPNILSFQNYL